MIEAGPDRFEFDFVIDEGNFVDNFESVNQRYFIYSAAMTVFLVVFGIVAAIGIDQVFGILVLVGGVFLGVFSSRAFTLWRMRRAAKATIGTTGHAVIDDSGIEIRHSAGTSRLNWTGLNTVHVTRGTMTFLRGKVMWGWIGINGLDSRTRDRVVAFVRAHVPAVA